MEELLKNQDPIIQSTLWKEGLLFADQIWDVSQKRFTDKVTTKIKTAEWSQTLRLIVMNYFKDRVKEHSISRTHLAIQKDTVVDIWTDGSLKDNQMGAGYLIYNKQTNEQILEKKFRVTIGSMSSSTPEKWAVIDAIRQIPDEITAHIYTDSQVVIDNSRTLDETPALDEVTKSLKRIIKLRKGETKFHKVKSHSNLTDLRNDMADTLANQGRDELPDQNIMQLVQIEGNQTYWINDKPLSKPLKRTIRDHFIENDNIKLKKSTTIGRSMQWNFEISEASLKTFISSIANKNSRGTLRRGFTADQERLFNIKRISGLLPVQTKINRWYFNESPICKRCNHMPETMEHVIECPKSSKARQRIISHMDFITQRDLGFTASETESIKALSSGKPPNSVILEIQKVKHGQEILKDYLKVLNKEFREAIWLPSRYNQNKDDFNLLRDHRA